MHLIKRIDDRPIFRSATSTVGEWSTPTVNGVVLQMGQPGPHEEIGVEAAHIPTSESGVGLVHGP